VEPREERFNLLWREHHRAVTKFVVRRLRRNEDPSDVVSEVFVTAWRRIDELVGTPQQARPWLYGVAHKTLANRLRSSRRRSALETRLALERPPADQANPHHSELAGDIETAALVEAFNSLTVSDREAIALVTWEDLTAADAAHVVGISVPRFRVRLHRARQRLRDRAAEISLAMNQGHPYPVTNAIEEAR